MIEYKLSLASSGAVKAPGYEDMLRFGVAEAVIPEPEGGAQADPSRTLWNLDRALTACLEPLLKESAVSLTERRYQKFRALGRGKEDA